MRGYIIETVYDDAGHKIDLAMTLATTSERRDPDTNTLVVDGVWDHEIVAVDDEARVY